MSPGVTRSGRPPWRASQHSLKIAARRRPPEGVEVRQRGQSRQPVKGRRVKRANARKESTSGPSVGDLQKQLDALSGELKEAREQQTATAEVLQVINSSPGDLAPIFDEMLQKALGLCGAAFGQLVTFDGVVFRAAAWRGYEPGPSATTPLPGMALHQLVHGEQIVHIPDITADDVYRSGNPVRRRLADEYGGRTAIWVALRKDEELLGAFVIFRTEVRPFSDKQIALLQSFAAQAVIAIENARLFNETKEALERQTATADILKVIASSPSNVQPVFEAIAESAKRLLGSRHAVVTRVIDDTVHLAAFTAGDEEGDKALQSRFPMPLSGPGPNSRAARTGEIERVTDTETYLDSSEDFKKSARARGFRSVLVVPMLRNGVAIGTIATSRRQPGSFADKEIDLLRTFADQAVIAIENARLFEELRERQAELRTTFDNMGDGVAMFDAAARLAAWNRNLQEMLELPDALLAKRPSLAELFRYLAARGEFGSDLEVQLSRSLEDTRQEMSYERTRPDGRIIEVRRNPVPDGGFVLIYADITERKRAEEAIRAARDAAETALRELQKTQASLVHAQKMAALGQLTAGIAHEIKNPLNFVNNFAGLSVELLEELKEAVGEAIGTLGTGKRSEIFETIGMLTGNLEKIAEHGRRADGIVRGMLQHSRGSSGDWQATDLNALVEESLNLAYHGARAQDQDFKVTWELDLDRNLAPIEVVSQDVSRVLLNLISNGFYGVTKRGREGDRAFRPALKIATRELAEGIEIRVRDNGVGIPLEHRDKLFQPFFTTKPTGEGTGLGLSISYEIVTQQHGGTITVDSQVGDFTEFTVWLPRRRHAVAGKVG
jgi:two-component system, NtrC family, sensor kinase